MNKQGNASTLIHFFYLGLPISYGRVLSLATDRGSTVRQRYRYDNVVCALNMCCDLFTIAAVDNLNYNPSSPNSKDSFHGTIISLFNNLVKLMPADTETAIFLIRIFKETPLDHSWNLHNHQSSC